VGFTPYAGQGSLQAYRTVVGAGPATSGSTDTSQVFTATASTVQIGYGAYADGTGWLQQRSGTNYATNYALALQPNGGNVAIGTGNAAYGQLVIQKASSTTDGPVLTLWNSNSNAGNTCGYLRFFSNATARAEISSVIDSGGPFAGNFIFKTGENTLTEKMRISSDGNVGIGTASPTQRLAVNSANTSTNALFEVKQGDVTQAYVGMGTDNVLRLQSLARPTGVVAGGANHIFFTANSSERARISSAGGFSVGTTADPGAGAIFATGNITAYYSDARLKDFKGKIGDALYKVSQLNGYYYTENEKAEEFGYNNKELQVGVSAQEVQAILPEVVTAAPFDLDADGKSKSGDDYMTVRYEKLVPLLIEAIKELKAEVEALKAAK
jgi:hypothetical protein